MSGPSKVIVLDPDPRAGRLVQLGFEREGIGIALATPGAPLDIPPEAGAILVGGNDGTSVDLVRQARAALQTANLDIPIIAASRGAARADLEAAGADAILTPPTYLRDVVTACRILHGVPSQKRDHLVGNLAETTGSYSLVRVFAALGKSGVLTLIRGLRRGEVRFYKGEVTSAELGVIHGQAAFHQILLWTDARFDFAHHEIVRRQQIPLSPEELFADAERFLEGVRDAAGGLSPATVLEQDVQRIQDLGKQIPTEVFGVLRMFDGHRVLADILEDSPYRVFETLRVAQKAVEVGLLRPVVSQRPKATWRAVLAIDEWLVGNETRDAVVERTVDLDTGSHPVQKPPKSRSKKSRHKRTSSPMPTAKTDIDWGALVPRVIGAEVGPLSGVVPALAAHGEVEAPTRDREREKLEALMDTDKRDRIFPTEIGLEPKVVIAGMEAESAPPASAVPDEVDTVSSGSKRNKKKKADKAAAEKARQEAEKMARAAAEAARIAGEKAMAEKAAAAEKAAMAKADAEREAKAKIAAEMARIEAERVATEQARLEAERMAAQKTAAEMAAVDAEQAAAAERVAKEKIAAEMARIEAARVANEKASAETARLEAERAAKERIAAEMARIEAERVARDEAATAEKLAAERAAAERAAAEKLAAERAAAERATAERAAADRAAEAKAAAEAARAAEEKAFADKAPRSAADRAAADRAAADRAAADRAAADRAAADRAAAEQAAAEREIAESQSRVHENVERMRLDRLARDEADARAAAEAALSANAHAVEDARAYAARVKAAAEARRLEAERSRNEAVIDAAHASPREGGASSDARDLVRRLVADAVPPGASSSTASAAPPAEPAFLTTPPSDVDVAASRLVATPTSDAARASSTSDAANRLVATPTSDVAARGLVATPTSDAAARGLVATPTSDAAARGLVATPTSDAARATSSSDAADRLVASPMSGDTMRGVIPSSTSDAAANRLIATPTSDAAANRLIATPHDTDRGIIATPTSDAAANRLIATPHDTDRGIIATPTSDAASNRLIATPTSGDTERNIAVPMTGDTARGIVAASSGPAPTATSGATTLPHHSSSSDDALTRPFVRAEALMTDPVTVSEAGNTSVAVSDVVTVNRTSDTAMVTASPRVIISESVPASEMASTARAVSASSTIDRDDATTGRDDATTGRDDATPGRDDATPEETDDEPSDGVIRATIATADTARVAARARAMRPPEPEHDGPPVKEATGEIGDRRVRTGIQEKIELEPSILVNDLAAAHSAASAAVTKSAATPAPGDAASASKELDVATVRRDAVAFSADEEAFFKRAEGGTSQVPKFESFDDLDEGYEPTSFWGRVFGNKDKKKPPR